MPWVEIRTARGWTVRQWRRPVPRVPEWYLKSVVYLYPDQYNAEKAHRWGGTGFIVSVHGEWQGTPEFLPQTHYVVTARHVLKTGKVLRINTRDGKCDYVPCESGWTEDKEHDLAVLPIELPPGHFDVLGVPDYSLMPRERADVLAIPGRHLDVELVGPGDDVAMIGRFADHGGTARNEPYLRFGNISMMPGEPVDTQSVGPLEAFLVEMRSRGGFSGSPVFSYQVYMQLPWAAAVSEGRISEIFQEHQPPFLLGVDHGQFPTLLPVVDKDGRETGQFVKERSAITIVIPAWHLINLLKGATLANERKARSDAERRKPRAEPEAAEPEMSRAEFDEALKRVTRKVDDPQTTERKG